MAMADVLLQIVPVVTGGLCLVKIEFVPGDVAVRFLNAESISEHEVIFQESIFSCVLNTS
jgi:hypothetical protein